jgi:hypothetical protein
MRISTGDVGRGEREREGGAGMGWDEEEKFGF